MRGADLLIQTLAKVGVTKIFSLSGNQIMPVYDACIDAKIEIIHTRHEAAAIFMADAWAQLTGEVGIAMITAAPGFANGMGPLFTARLSESPVILLSGDSPIGQDGKGTFQELDQVSVSAPLTKASWRASTASDLGNDIARAIRTATSGRPGPVHIALPFDVVEEKISDVRLPSENAFKRETQQATKRDLDQIRTLIEQAEKPLILTGPLLNKTRAGQLMNELEQSLDAPVITMESPRGLKDPALGEFAEALNQADLVLNLGKVVDFTLGFGNISVCQPYCKWVLVDPDADMRDSAFMNLGSRLVKTIAADTRSVARALIENESGATSRADWRQQTADLISKRTTNTDKLVEGKISPAALCEAVQRQIDKTENSLVICDGGEFGQWAQAGTNAKDRLINGISGAIGGGLCYAVGAQKARPDATIFALMGDGTVGFHFAEFETAAREGTPFIVIIGNDECWNAEHQIQLRNYGPDRLIGCQLSGARYDLAAIGLGCHGEFVTDLSELDTALERAVSSGKPACINVEIAGLPAPAGSGH